MPDRNDLVDGLSPASIRTACIAIGMSDVSTRLLAETASAIAGSGSLREVALRCASLVFDSGLPVGEAIAEWPVRADRAGLPPFFDPSVLLAGFRRVAADHCRRGIPREVTQATLRDLDLWMDHHRAATGAWAARETGWIARHFTSRVFQIGRLQFEPRAFELPFAVFASRRGAAAAILAEGGRVFRPERSVRGRGWRRAGFCIRPAEVDLTVRRRRAVLAGIGGRCCRQRTARCGDPRRGRLGAGSEARRCGPRGPRPGLRAGSTAP